MDTTANMQPCEMPCIQGGGGRKESLTSLLCVSLFAIIAKLLADFRMGKCNTKVFTLHWQNLQEISGNFTFNCLTSNIKETCWLGSFFVLLLSALDGQIGASFFFFSCSSHICTSHTHILLFQSFRGVCTALQFELICMQAFRHCDERVVHVHLMDSVIGSALT